MAAMGHGGHESADSCRIKEVESGNCGTGLCLQTVEMGCDPFLMSVFWICWGWGNSIGAE